MKKKEIIILNYIRNVSGVDYYDSVMKSNLQYPKKREMTKNTYDEYKTTVIIVIIHCYYT